jgi:glycosyltransferase involved in cell wall biosynthesis
MVVRVGIEAWGIDDDDPRDGMSQYTASLLRGLPATGRVETVAFGAPGAARPQWLDETVRWRAPPPRSSRFAAIDTRLRWLPATVAADAIDVFHAPGVHVRPSFPPIPSVPAKLVVTVHDTIPLSYYGATLPLRNRLFYQWNLRRAASATRVLTVSHAARTEIAANTSIPAERIAVVTSAVTFAPNHDPRVASDLGVPSPFLLVAGSYEPRKNLAGALRAFDVFARDAPHHLVAVTERESGHAPATQAVVASLRFRDRVHLVHDLDETLLRALYTGADAIVFPSRAEGLGLPPIQAAACGIPVVVSPLPVYAESIGDLAITANTDDPLGFACALRRAVSSEARAHAARWGPARAAHFSAAEHARQHVEIYERVGERRGAAR